MEMKTEMKMKISPVKIKENPLNEVTSDKIFNSRKIKDKNGNFLFDADGIFSDRIFGKYNTCKCGNLTKPGICTKCGCRVLSKKKMPDFYIKFEFDLPNRFIPYEGENKEIIINLLNYNGFLYEGEYINLNIKDDDLTKYDDTKIKYGKDACLELGMSLDDYNKCVHRYVTIPHTSFRKITVQNDQYFLGEINTIYVDIIRKNNLYKKYIKSGMSNNPKYELNLKNYVIKNLNDLYVNLFNILATNNRSVVDNELIGQPETGMIRAVMTNNFSLPENNILIGSYFISTLYPKLAEKFKIEDGNIDIKALNQHLQDEDYLVLFNRQPTIGAKSFISMYPIFSEREEEKFVIQANPIVYDGLAADVDGDTLNVIALYTKEACQEAKKLLPSVNYIEGSNSSIRNGMPSEFIFVKSMEES